MQTFGWDTIYAISIEAVNEALAVNRQLLLNSFIFSFSEEISYQGSGKFGAWRVISGGSGEFLHLRLPIASGSLVIGSGTPIELSDLSVDVEVRLQLLRSENQADVNNLRFVIRSVGKTPGQTEPGVVTPLRLNDPLKKLEFEPAAILLGAIVQYLADHGMEIAWVFASIGPVRGQQSWLSPSSSGFYYYSSPHGAYLVIQSVTTAHDISSLPRQLDPTIIDGSPQAAFAFSKELFLRNVIQPILPAIFGHGTTAASFRYESSDSTLMNTGQIAVDSVQSGAIWYDPHIDALKIWVNGSTLVAAMHGSCDMKMDITMTFGIQSCHIVSIDLAAGTLNFAADPSPVTHHDTSVPWYDYLMGVLPDIILSITVPLVADGIAAGLNLHAGNLAIGNAPPLSIHWTGLEKFKATSAGMNESFYLRGNLA